MRNKVLLAAATAVAFTGSAFAAEPLPPPPVYVPPPPVPPWTGFYVGAQIGGAWGSGALSNFNGFDPITGTFVNTSLGGTPSGVIGGGHLGYQIQINQWILGLEGSVDGTSLTKDVNAAFPNFGNTLLRAQTSADIQGSIRGKLGIAWGRFMIYGTGGVAFGGFNTDWQISSPNGFVTPRGVVIPPFFASDNFSTTRVGWTAGGGAQFAVTPNWWVFVEYRFSDFGTVRNGAFPNLPTGFFFNGERRLQENQVQAGFSYKFDLLPPPAPIVATSHSGEPIPGWNYYY
jgi:outer membrane immunogenic protein